MISIITKALITTAKREIDKATDGELALQLDEMILKLEENISLINDIAKIAIFMSIYDRLIRTAGGPINE